MTTCAQGSQARLCVEPGASPHTFDTNSEPYEFLYETIQKRGRIVGGNGIRGTRSAHSARTRLGAYEIGGRLAMNVDPAGLDLWLPRILGATESADSFALAESLPAFGVLVDRVTQTFAYGDCKVARAMFHGKAGPGDSDPDLIEMVLEILGLSETTGTSYPALTLSTASNAAPYVMSDASTVTIAGASRKIKEFWLVIDNFIEPRYVTGSNAPATLCPKDRMVMLRATFPFDDDHDDLHDLALAGAAGTLTFTNGGLSTSFAFGTLQAPANSPTVRGKTEIDITLDLVARMTGSTRELVVTSDSVS